MKHFSFELTSKIGCSAVVKSAHGKSNVGNSATTMSVKVHTGKNVIKLQIESEKI